MAINDLLAIVAAPDSPVDPFDPRVWASIEAKLGLVFPDDYKDLSKRFGSGCFRTAGTLDLRMENPCSAAYLDAFERNRGFLRYAKELWKELELPEQIPYDSYPPAPGLLQWAHDDNGWTYFWLVRGEPTTWPILVFQANEEIRLIESSITSFLTDFFSHRLSHYCWANLLSQKASFVPAKK